MSSKIQKIKFYYRADNLAARKWEGKLKKWIKSKHLEIKIIAENSKNSPEAIIALGGDGTILEASKKCVSYNALLIGFNLGQVGFLASVRDEKNFFSSLEKVFEGKYSVSERMMIEIVLSRKGKIIFQTLSLNELAVINPLGMVEIDVSVNDFEFQKIRGTGVLLSTPTGSTAFNLSAHGPIMMPDNKGIILTELFDHNIPAPSIILNSDQEVSLEIKYFRKKNLLKIGPDSDNGFVNAILSADGETIYPLEIGDVIKIKQSTYTAKFCELEKSYFLRSFKEKFEFK